MTRDLYRAPHKALRRDLFEVSSLIGSTDFSDPASVGALVVRFDGMVAALRHHGEMEDNDIHPVARSLGLAELEAIERDHDEVEGELDALVAALGGLAAAPGPQRWDDARAFYLRFNRYVAAYLLHADREERELMPALAAATDPAELERLARADVAAPVEALVGAMHTMLPLFDVEDRRVLLADIRAGLAADEYTTVASAAEAVLAPAEWAKLAS